MRPRHTWLLLGAAICSFGVWTWLFSRMFTRAPEAPPEKPVIGVHVTGHGAERVIAQRLTWSIDVCAANKSLATEHARDAVRRAQKLLDADDVVASAATPDGAQDERSCVTLEVSSAKVEAALRWHRALLAAKLIDRDDASEPECLGDQGLSAAKAKASMTAIADARAQADLLMHQLPTLPGLSADVQHDEGSWDAQCERIVTATADLTMPTTR